VHPAHHTTAAPATRADTLARITRLVARVEWKAHMLLVSRSVTASVSVNTDNPATDTHTNPNTHTQTARETMFRLDFYEFYALLERLLVLLLCACGIAARRNSLSLSNSNSNPGITGTHRFHANVLAALEREDCPLREALGRGEARRQLARAKEFRNRWKDADGQGEVQEQVAGLDGEGLHGMLEAVLEGVRGARGVVEGLVVQGSGDGAVRRREDGAGGVLEDQDLEMDDVPWEAVEDAMDWDWDGS